MNPKQNLGGKGPHWSDDIPLRPEHFRQWQDPAFLAAMRDFMLWFIENPGSTTLSEPALNYIRLIAPRGRERIDLYVFLMVFGEPLNGVYSSPEEERLARQRIAILQAMIDEVQAHL